jgi:ferritin-like metal-binding protein YciE
MKIKTLEEAFLHELSDMYNAEKQLTKALPKMAKAANDSKLARAFEMHLKETEGHVAMVEQAAEKCEMKLKREKCEAMEGLVEEGSDVIKNVEDGAIRDAMLIAAAQKVEHYEIASYGTLTALAEKLGFMEAGKILHKVLDQEKAADEKLNTLAEQGVNDKAMRQAA